MLHAVAIIAGNGNPIEQSDAGVIEGYLDSDDDMVVASAQLAIAHLVQREIMFSDGLPGKIESNLGKSQITDYSTLTCLGNLAVAGIPLTRDIGGKVESMLTQYPDDPERLYPVVSAIGNLARCDYKFSDMIADKIEPLIDKRNKKLRTSAIYCIGGLAASQRDVKFSENIGVKLCGFLTSQNTERLSTTIVAIGNLSEKGYRLARNTNDRLRRTIGGTASKEVRWSGVKTLGMIGDCRDDIDLLTAVIGNGEYFRTDQHTIWAAIEGGRTLLSKADASDELTRGKAEILRETLGVVNERCSKGPEKGKRARRNKRIVDEIGLTDTVIDGIMSTRPV